MNDFHVPRQVALSVLSSAREGGSYVGKCEEERMERARGRATRCTVCLERMRYVAAETMLLS